MRSMILAADRNGGIGYEGKLPWPRIAEDMAWFRHVTMQHKRCIMGRKTWESVGALEGRDCHVVTSEADLKHEGGITVHTSPPPLEDGDVVIGGASLYEHYADHVDVVFLTEVNGAYEPDVKVDLKHLLEGKFLRDYVVIINHHAINVYTRPRTMDTRIKAIGILRDFETSLKEHDCGSPSKRSDHESLVDSPTHYTQGGIETIDAIKAITAGYRGEDAFCAGNVAKYIARAPFKGNRAEDLQKALWYLERLITNGDNDDY